MYLNLVNCNLYKRDFGNDFPEDWSLLFDSIESGKRLKTTLELAPDLISRESIKNVKEALEQYDNN